VNTLFFKGNPVTKSRSDRQPCFPFCCFESQAGTAHLSVIGRRTYRRLDFKKNEGLAEMSGGLAAKRDKTMRKFLIASAAVLSLSGIAAAQEAPALIYSDSFAQNVQNAGVPSADRGLTVTSQRNASVPVQGAGQTVSDIRNNPNYQGGR